MSTRPRDRALDVGILLLGTALETGLALVPSIDTPRFVLPAWLLVLVILVGYLPLLWRRRFPRAVLVWMCALACLQLVIAPLFVFGVVVAVFGIGRYCRPWQAPNLLLVGFPILAGNLGISDPSIVVLNVVTFVVLFTGVWWAGFSLRMAELLRRQQQRLMLEAARQHRRQERLALARELHDSVAGSISAMVLQAAGAKAVRRRREAPEEPALDVIADTGTQATHEMHRLLELLRSEDDTLDLIVTETASHEDLPDLVAAAERRGLRVELEVDGAPHEVSAPVSTAAYRVVQESLTNALKYAGTGSAVDVEVHWHPQDLELEVRSHSHRPNLPRLPSTGYGLAGLGERIRLVGGTFSFRQEQDAFITSATLPLTESGSSP